jgi:hypothetical protein
MKFQEDRPLATPEAAERKLLELAKEIEADQGRAPVSEINTQFMAAGGSAAEYARAVEAAMLSEGSEGIRCIGNPAICSYAMG